MEKGSYIGRRVDFAKYATSCFTPHLFARTTRMGCGACALALLTGVPPEVIVRKNNSPHYSDEFVVRFLRKREFSVLPLTLCNVSTSKSPIANFHVLLLSQLITRNEATWLVLHNELCYHGFDVYNATILSFVNKPVLTAYLLVHPKWRERLTSQKFRLRRPKSDLTLNGLLPKHKPKSD